MHKKPAAVAAAQHWPESMRIAVRRCKATAPFANAPWIAVGADLGALRECSFSQGGSSPASSRPFSAMTTAAQSAGGPNGLQARRNTQRDQAPYPPIRIRLVAGLRVQDLPAVCHPVEIAGSRRLSTPAHLGPASLQMQPVRRPEIQAIPRPVLSPPSAMRPRSLGPGPGSGPAPERVGGHAPPGGWISPATTEAAATISSQTLFFRKGFSPRGSERHSQARAHATHRGVASHLTVSL